MKRLRETFHRRSLTLALYALVLAFLAGYLSLFLFFSRAPGPKSITGDCALFLFASAMCAHAVFNLIQDVERGYSPERCSLAAVILLGATVVLCIVGFGLVRYFLGWGAGP